MAPLRACAARRDAAQDRGAARPPAADGGVVHLRRAQGHRVHAGAPRPQPGGAEGVAATGGGRREAHVQGADRPGRREPGAVRAGAGDLADLRAGGVGGGAVLGFPGDRRRQRRAALRPRDDLARGVRGHHRGMGLELEVRPARCDALRRPDRGLRDRDGVRPRRGADGRGQPQSPRDRARPGGGAGPVVLAAPAADVRGLRDLRDRGDQPRPPSTSPRASPRSWPASTWSTRGWRSRCSSSPSTRT